MCNLDMIVGPNPIFLSGTVLVVAIGILLLCGIVLVTMGFIRASKKKNTEKDDRK